MTFQCSKMAKITIKNILTFEVISRWNPEHKFTRPLRVHWNKKIETQETITAEYIRWGYEEWWSLVNEIFQHISGWLDASGSLWGGELAENLLQEALQWGESFSISSKVETTPSLEFLNKKHRAINMFFFFFYKFIYFNWRLITLQSMWKLRSMYEKMF